MLGLKHNVNLLVDYDPTWESEFVVERFPLKGRAIAYVRYAESNPPTRTVSRLSAFAKASADRRATTVRTPHLGGGGSENYVRVSICDNPAPQGDFLARLVVLVS